MPVHRKTAITYFDCIIAETLSKAVFIDISGMYSCITEGVEIVLHIYEVMQSKYMITYNYHHSMKVYSNNAMATNE